MSAGVGLFGTFTAYIASLFMEAEHKKEGSDMQTLIEEVRLLRSQVEALANNHFVK
jgi:voltage-gated potassium channel